MPPAKDIRNAAVIDFMIENYEKEKRLRVKWNQDHKELIAKAVLLARKPTNYTSIDINKAIMVAGMPNTTRENVAGARNRLVKPAEDYLLFKDQTTIGEAIMKPVEKQVSDFKKESRMKYLKVRNNKAPEDKFNYIEASNWTYGWELNKSMQKTGQFHGRCCTLMQNLQERSGPYRDPDHYNSAEAYKNACSL